MNNKTTYETLITEKLNGLTVPDMADAIWAKIDLELGAAPGTGETGNQQPSAQATTANVMTTATNMWLIIVAVAALAILILWVAKNNRAKDPPDEKKRTIILPEPVKQQPDSASSFVPRKAASTNTVTAPLQPKAVEIAPPVISPAVSERVPNEYYNDLNDAPPVINRPPLATGHDSITIPPLKKSRGVKNIGDDDYKIINTKKDTTRN